VITVTSLNGEGSGQIRSAPFVVGCDGANSIVRAQINAATVDLGSFFDWLIVDVVLNNARVFDPPNLQVCDPLRPGRTFPQSNISISVPSGSEGPLGGSGRPLNGRADDVLGRRWKLVGRRGLREALATDNNALWFAKLGDIVELADLKELIGPIDPENGCAESTLSGWFVENDLAVALVRPDAIIFGASKRLSDFGLLLNEARTALGA
jgi:2-polyprenyl-6-methoxyphenol hydroxylase-like FAD-dependent oxidoreductase